jgi:hypothetical protein
MGLIVENKWLKVLTAMVFIVVTLCFCQGIIYLSNNNESLGIAWTSLGVAFLGSLAGVISLLVSKESTKISEKSLTISNKSMEIAKNSDDKMKDIALSFYKEIEGIFEDRRLSIMKARRIIDVKKKKKMDTEVDEFVLHQDIIFGIWKCLTYLRQAEALIKWIDDSEQGGIIKLLEHFYKELKIDIIEFGIVIPDEYCGHLEQMHGIISKFKLYPKDYDKRHIPIAKRLLERLLVTNKELEEAFKKKNNHESF